MGNFNFKKKYGQNFLRNDLILSKIVNSIEIQEHDKIIEIGPGDGSLTKKLITLSDNILCFEIDNSLKKYLDKLDNNKVSIIYGDFLNFKLIEYLKTNEKFYCIANIPYYITTPIIMKFIKENIIPSSMVLMVQKEVGKRLSSDSGNKDYGAITVILNYYYNIEYLFDVNRENFYPIPNVDSAVIKLTSRNNRLYLNNFSFFEKVVNNAFMYKRKTLKNNLKMYDLSVIEKVLNKYNFSLSNRAEDINYEIYVEIANSLY